MLLKTIPGIKNRFGEIMKENSPLEIPASSENFFKIYKNLLSIKREPTAKNAKRPARIYNVETFGWKSVAW